MERTESMGEAQVPKDTFLHAIKTLVLVKKCINFSTLLQHIYLKLSLQVYHLIKLI